MNEEIDTVPDAATNNERAITFRRREGSPLGEWPLVTENRTEATLEGLVRQIHAYANAAPSPVYIVDREVTILTSERRRVRTVSMRGVMVAEETTVVSRDVETFDSKPTFTVA